MESNKKKKVQGNKSIIIDSEDESESSNRESSKQDIHVSS